MPGRYPQDALRSHSPQKLSRLTLRAVKAMIYADSSKLYAPGQAPIGKALGMR